MIGLGSGEPSRPESAIESMRRLPQIRSGEIVQNRTVARSERFELPTPRFEVLSSEPSPNVGNRQHPRTSIKIDLEPRRRPPHIAASSPPFGIYAVSRR